jgi:transposase
MSLHPRRLDAVPQDTREVARAAFPKGHPYLRLRDELGALYADEEYADLFSLSGQSAQSPGRLALVLVLQELEGLSDRQAADAVRGRLEWKYLLGLPLRDAGFDYSVLSAFRARLLAGGAEARAFERLLEVCRAQGLLKARGRQRTDATRVLSAARDRDRLECGAETLRHTLEVLVEVAPGWLGAWLEPEWGLRYGRPWDTYRLPQEEAARQALTLQVGADGFALLTRAYAADAPGWLRAVPAVETLRRVWVQQYRLQDEQVLWRGADELPPAEQEIRSPYDVQARYASKRGVGWCGYKVHLTETCDADTPHLLTNVETTPATPPDVAVLPAVHDHLAARGVLPGEHLVDAGYADAAEFRRAADLYRVEVVGRLRADTSRQAHQARGYDQSAFRVDWAAQAVTCPQGQVSPRWRLGPDASGAPRVTIKFPARVCQACAARALCTRATTGGRTITLPPREVYEALRAQRAYQATPEFRARYAARAGVEGTLSQGVNALGLRAGRYCGLAKTRLQHLFTATAINLCRLADWFAGAPRAATRTSRLTRFAAALPL